MGSVNGGFIGDDARSHVSGYSLNKGSGMNLMRSRSLAEGQSQRAMSAMSGRYLSAHGLHHINGNDYFYRLRLATINMQPAWSCLPTLLLQLSY